MQMENLFAYNERRRHEIEQRKGHGYPVLNSVACPKCGNELVDIDITIFGDPPQTNVECLMCGFRGSRLLGGIY